MAKNKLVKSVSFNITNATDAKILEAIKRRNFSGYVKKLLLADIEAKKGDAPIAPKALPVKLSSSDRLAQLKKQMAAKPKLTD